MRKHIKTVNKAMLNKTLRTGGCGECPASCQSACKTSCTVGAGGCFTIYAKKKGWNTC